MAQIPEAVAVSEDGFSMPVEEILTGRGFITGKSGSGKSNTASVVAEELLAAGISLFIVDTDGEYYGLGEQFEVLHAGADDDCDVQVDISDADMLAKTALVENVPVVLDVSGFLDGEQVNDIIEAVVKALFQREKRERKPFLLFVEEVHEFIPETGGLDDLGEMLIRVAKRGRKRGLGLVGMSQRPAAVDKDFITQCDWIVWHRLTWDNDTRVVGQILGGDAAEAVQDLATGEALVMTDWDEAVTRVTFRRKWTLDAGATPGLAALSEEDLGSAEEVEPPDAAESPPDTGENDGSDADPAADGEPESGDEAAGSATAEDAGPDDDAGVDDAPDRAGTAATGAAVGEPESTETATGETTDDADGEPVTPTVEMTPIREQRTVPAEGDRRPDARSTAGGRAPPGGSRQGRGPPESHPSDDPPAQLLWELGHMLLHVTVAWLRTLGRFARWLAGSVRAVGSWLRGRSPSGPRNRERPPVGDVLLSLLVLLVLAAVVVLGLGML